MKTNYTATTDTGKAFRQNVVAWTNEKSVNEVTTATLTATVKKFLADNADAIPDLQKAEKALTVNKEGKKRFAVDRTTEKALFDAVADMLPFGEVNARVDVTADCEEVVTGYTYTDGLFSGYTAIYNGESRRYFDNAVRAIVKDFFNSDGSTTDLSNFLLASVGYTATQASKARTKGAALASLKSRKQFTESIVNAIASYFNGKGMDCISRTTVNKLQYVANKRIEKRYNVSNDNLKRLLEESGLYEEKEKHTATLKATA